MRSWWVFALAGCYAPGVPSGVMCGEGGACPSGQFCVNGTCQTSPGAETDAAEPDAPVDAAFDAPVDTTVPVDMAIDAPPPMPMTLRFGNRPGALANTLDDVFLDGKLNTGGHPDLHLESGIEEPILVRVDLSSVPAQATVTSARLSFYVSADVIPQGTEIEVFTMNQSWTEGTADYEPGVANLDERNAGQDWSAIGARPPSRSSNPVAMVSAAQDLDVGEELSIPIPAALVMGWLANPTSNHGVAILVDAKDFYAELRSTEANTASLRPMLEIEVQ